MRSLLRRIWPLLEELDDEEAGGDGSSAGSDADPRAGRPSLGMTVDGVFQLIYDGELPAMPERASGRLLVGADVERIRRRSS
jgi:hypothetical protein